MAMEWPGEGGGRRPWGKGMESEDAMGGEKKKGFWTPPRLVRSHYSLFLHKKPQLSRPDALLEGPQTFLWRARSLVRCPHPYFFHPPHIMAQWEGM